MNKQKGLSLILLIIIVSIIVVVGTLTIVLVSKNDNNENKTENENISSIPSNDNATQKNNDNAENSASKSSFWIDNYTNWEEQKEPLDLKLFDGQFSAPIDLKAVDSFAKRIYYFPNNNKIEVNSINEILNSETIATPSKEVSIWINYGDFSEEKNRYTGSINVKLKNYNKKDSLSIKECFNNKWWHITIENNSCIQECLGITTDDPQYNANWDGRPLLNEVISTLGGPKHIYSYINSESSHAYGLHYEYSEFSIHIYVNEILAGGNYMCKVGYITYGTNEYWEEKLKKDAESSSFKIIK